MAHFSEKWQKYQKYQQLINEFKIRKITWEQLESKFGCSIRREMFELKKDERRH